MHRALANRGVDANGDRLLLRLRATGNRTHG
jgi:hypothetical protein